MSRKAKRQLRYTRVAVRSCVVEEPGHAADAHVLEKSDCAVVPVNQGKPETFNFLGFTHHCGQRHKTKTFTVWRITAPKRMAAKLKDIKAGLQRRMHDRVVEVGAWLSKVVSGYYLYHAVPGNIDQLYLFRAHREFEGTTAA